MIDLLNDHPALGDFDLPPICRAIGVREGLLKVQSLGAAADGLVEVGAEGLWVSGNVEAGAVVCGSGPVVVEGSVLGNGRVQGRIETSADVIILGDVEHGYVAGKTVRIAESASDCVLKGHEGIEVGGNVGPATLHVGDFETERREIQDLENEMNTLRSQAECVERQVYLEQRRVDKTFRTTRINLTSDIGRILLKKKNRLEVDLQHFYAIAGDKTEAELDRAVDEFFARAIVGRITMDNRGFVRSGPNRRGILMGAIRGLRELFLVSRKRDKMNSAIQTAGEQLDALLEALTRRPSAVYIKGTLHPETQMRFVIPEVVRGGAESEPLALSERTSEVSVIAQDPEHLRVVGRQSDGSEIEEQMDRYAFAGGSRFGIEEGRLMTCPVNARQMVPA